MSIVASLLLEMPDSGKITTVKLIQLHLSCTVVM